VAEEFVRVVMEAARAHRRTVAQLVDELRVAGTLADVEQIKAQLTQATDRYEAVLMTATIGVQARNDRLAARLKELGN
jgi:hypothetical protein